ncbi:MAG: hypothetical protein EHM85_11900 [Desulfobacteraceae bacterium]|nr:MAG: hypothetical protein EHM85_11900 [Desulfobacteraceae bacterium]
MNQKKIFGAISCILITLTALLLIIFQWSWSSVKYRPSEKKIAALRNRGLNIEKTWKSGIFRFYLTGEALVEDPSMEGAYYEGQLNAKGQFHGRGKIVFPDGNWIDGEFVEGFIEGFAVSVEPDGSRKEGQYRRGKMYGQGKEIRADGIRYKGEWKDDEWHGWGTATLPNGGSLTGLWNQGSFEGIGKDTCNPPPAKDPPGDSAVPIKVPYPNRPKIITAA